MSNPTRAAKPPAAHSPDETTDPTQAGDDLLAELVDDFLRRHRAGERPGVDEYAHGHTDLADRIRDLFPAMLAMEQPGLGVSLDAAPPAERVGSTIGRYKLLERIGEGGFGVVYMAEQRHPIRRKVALKVLKPGVDTRQVIARFEAERQALAMMDHESIAKVFDAGATDSGRPYFAMELVHGVPITDYCDKNQLPPRERLELFVQVCRAVQHAHTKSVVHRDIKPTNVLVTLHEGVPVPKVIDFGVAKAAGQQLTEKTLFTNFQQMVGTPLYMSPEQAEMAGIDVDTRSDVYSLGVLLYELLTGTTPVDGARLRQAAFDEVRRIIREEEPPRPSTRLSTIARQEREVPAARRKSDPRRLGRLFRGELDWIVMKALEKDRRRRYQTANELSMDLQRYLADEPVLARPPTGAYRLRKFARRHSAALGAAAAVLAALVVGLAVSTAGFVRARHERDAARASAAHEEAVSAFLRETLATMPETAHGPTVSVRSLLDRAADRLDRGSFNDVPRAEAAVRTTLGRAYAALHLDPAAEPHFAAALRIQERLHPGRDHPDVALALRDLADVKPARTDGEAAEALARRALAMTRRLWPADSREVADAQSTMAGVLVEKGDYAGAEPLYADALRILRGLGKDGPEVATVLSNLADVLRLGNGGPAAAEPLHREALRIFLGHFGERHASVGEAYRNLAGILHARGDLRGAESMQRQALQSYRDALGENNRLVLDTIIGLSRIVSAAGEHERAVDLLLERERWLTAQPAPPPADDVRLSQQIAWVYRAWGRRDQAAEWRGRARSVQHRSLLKELERASLELRRRPDDAALLASRAKHHACAGLFTEAAADYDRAMALGVPDHWSWCLRAALLAYLGRDRAYAAHCREMLARFSTATGRPSVRIAKACLLLPAPGIDLAALNKTATDRRARDFYPKDVAWDEMAIGMAAHRRNHPGPAVEHLARALSMAESTPAAAATGFYLSINLHRLGRTEQADQAFDRAAQAMAELPSASEGDLGESGIENWLIAHVARREATRVLHPENAK